MSGNRASDPTDRWNLARVSAGRLCVEINRARSAAAVGVTTTVATDQRSSRDVPAPASASPRPCSARSNAPGIESSRSVTWRASGSASSSAVARSDRAIVPGFVCVRSARRWSFVARSSSRTTFTRLVDRGMKVSVHKSARDVQCGHTGSTRGRRRSTTIALWSLPSPSPPVAGVPSCSRTSPAICRVPAGCRGRAPGRDVVERRPRSGRRRIIARTDPYGPTWAESGVIGQPPGPS